MAIVPAARLYDWSLGTNVGVEGGIPARTQTIFATINTGTSASSINSTIASCPVGQVVLFTNGTHDLTDTIVHKQGVVLRGSGSTVWAINHNNTWLKLEGGSEIATAGTNISSGFTMDSTSVVVASASGLAIGDLIKIDQLHDNDIMWAANEDGTAERGIIDLGIITNVSGTTITFKPPICYGNTGNGTPKLKHFNNGEFRDAGIEDITLDGTGTTATWGILMVNCVNCWLDNVRTKQANAYHVYMLNCLFCTGQHCYLDDSPDYLPNHGGFVVGNVDFISCKGILLVNNIGFRILPAFEINAGTCGSVIAYNYVHDPRYGTTSQGVGINMNHGPTCCKNLYEGNITPSFYSDGYFGGSLHNTCLRNWATGWTETFLDDNSRPFQLCKWSIGDNLLGNVIGHSSFTPDQFELTGDDVGYDTSCSYALGYPNGGNGDYDGLRPPSTDRVDALDTNVKATLIRHGNWDKKTGGRLWETDNTNTEDYTDQNIPVSLIYDEKPSWFGDREWPPIEAANGLTGLSVESIPAGYRFINGEDPPPDAGEELEITLSVGNFGTMIVG